MDQQTTYALLAAESYFDTRREFNRAPLPPGWKLLDEFTRSGSGSNATLITSGFSARVYQGPANEIVISYGGTEFNLHDNATGAVIDFVSGNVLALGVYGEQAFQAAKLYQEVQQRFGTAADISFTGHSLGGGLAGLMAVWFDRPAIVFAPAPFEASAYALSDALVRTRARLHDANFRDPKFDSYNFALDFASREARVTSYSIKDEVLHLLPFPFIWGGDEHVLYQTGASGISATQRHSIDLHAAALLSPAFESAANAMPEVLTVLFDTRLYGSEPVSTSLDALIRLVRGQVGEYSPSTGQQIAAPTNLLDKFTTDIDQLRGDTGTATQLAMRKALIAASIEYFFLKTPVEATQLFSTSGGAVHFKFSDIAANVSALKSPHRLADAAQALEDPNRFGVVSSARLATAWHVQSGSTAMTWTDANGLDDAAIGGTQADNLDGAAGSDLLMGLGGNDTLKGGAGNDTLFGGVGDDLLDGGTSSDYLYGGIGTDTYKFASSFGSDTIIDSGGQGKIEVEVDGVEVKGTGAKKVSATTNSWSTDQWAFTLVPNGSGAGGNDLILQRDSSLNQIRIKNWVDGQLGIGLGTDVAAPTVDNTFTGDFAKATNAEGTAFLTSNGRYVDAGAQAGAQDLINGSTLADSIVGGGGNDGLAGGDGDDLIEGGAGSDVLLGGWGADTLRGGEGNDFIFGSSSGAFSLPTSVDYTPIASQGAELARGFSWVVYDPAGSDGNGVDAISFAGMGSVFANGEADGNLIEGGAGNDYIIAGSGDEVVYGGVGDDDIIRVRGTDALFGGIDIPAGAATHLTQRTTSRSGRTPVRRRWNASVQGVAR